MLYFILFILSSTLSYAQEFSVNWSCDRIDVESSTLSLPQYQKIKVIYSEITDTMTMKPDIFNEINVGDKKRVVDIKSCVKRLIQSLNSLKIEGKLEEKLNVFIFSSNYFKQLEKLDTIPRVYSGHEIKDQISGSVIKKFCEDKKLTSEDILKVTSRNFLDLIAQNLDKNKDVSDKCIEKLKKINEQFDYNFNNCKNCDKIINAKKKRDESLEILRQNQLNFFKKKEIQSLKENGFKIDDPITRKLIVDSWIEDIKPEAPKRYDLCNRRINSSVGTYKSSIKSFEQVYDYDEAISDVLEIKKDELSKPCVEDILKSYVRYKESHRKDNLCNSTFCNDKVSIYHKNIKTLMDMLFVDKQERYFCENYKSINYSDWKSFESFFEDINEVGMCTELKVGESKVLPYKYKGSISHSHGLKKVSDNEYEASLAIDFTSSDPKLNDEMRERVNECIAKTSDYFRGPSGEVMRLKILTPQENESLPIRERLELNQVGISPKDKSVRSNSRNYDGNIDCPTITHELLHLMGLVDEYHESLNQVYYNEETKEAYSEDYFPKDKKIENYKAKVAYVDCRAHSTTNSVMASQRNRFADAIKDKVTCKCETPECSKFMKDEKLKKLALFQEPREFNFYKNCKQVSSKRQKLSSISNFDNKYYQNIKFDGAQLSFTTQKVDFGSSWSENKTAGLEVVAFSCKCNDEECKKDIQNYKEKYLDQNRFHSRDYCPSRASIVKDKSEEMVKYDSSDESDLKDDEFSFVTTPTVKSLLHPAHFEKMKWGSCSTKAKKYNKCAEYAYKLINFQCEDRPKYCDNEEEWLLSK